MVNARQRAVLALADRIATHHLGAEARGRVAGQGRASAPVTSAENLRPSRGHLRRVEDTIEHCTASAPSVQANLSDHIRVLMLRRRTASRQEAPEYE